ncbi:uncharacterized protein [Ciconia boyciana]|uniref:uncharacterized protein isoform X1 n=1 Tax=Ciconia boyciana TaxID=52775 RepID=UPI003B9E291F
MSSERKKQNVSRHHFAVVALSSARKVQDGRKGSVVVCKSTEYLKSLTAILASVRKAVKVKEETWPKRDKWASLPRVFQAFPRSVSSLLGRDFPDWQSFSFKEVAFDELPIGAAGRASRSHQQQDFSLSLKTPRKVNFLPRTQAQHVFQKLMASLVFGSRLQQPRYDGKAFLCMLRFLDRASKTCSSSSSREGRSRCGGSVSVDSDDGPALSCSLTGLSPCSSAGRKR